MKNEGRLETIVNAILQGELSKEEAERRLQAVIDEELSGPLEKQADMELVGKCQSLLWALKTNGQIPYEDHASQNKQKLLQKLEAKMPEKKRPLTFRLGMAAAAVVLLLGLGFFSAQWLRGESGKDQQQYILQGSELFAGLVPPVTADFGEVSRLTTASREEAEAFLGTEIPLPSRLMGEYTAVRYDMGILPHSAFCQVIYACGEDRIAINLDFVTDFEEFRTTFEQRREGKEVEVAGARVYTSDNMGRHFFVWTEGNVVHHLYIVPGYEEGLQIVNEIRRNEE